MKKFILFTLIAFWANFYIKGQTWPQYYGGAGIEKCNKSVAINNGMSSNIYDNIFMAGSTTSAGSGGTDAFIVKTDMFGNEILNKTYGSLSDEVINSICQFSRFSDPSTIYFINSGYTTVNGDKDIYVQEIDTNGIATLDSTVFISAYGDDELLSIKSFSEGYIHGAGYTTTIAGDKDFYMVKLEEMWSPITMISSQTFGGSGDDVATSIDGDGFQLFGMAGYSNSFNGGTDNDIYVVNYDDMQGMLSWDTTYGGAGEDIAYDISFAYDMNYGTVFYVVGSTNSFGAGGKDVYILKLNATTGDTIWTRTFGGINDDEALDVYIQGADGYNYIVVSGYTIRNGATDKDAYILKLNELGDTLWTNTFGQIGIDDIATNSIYANCEWYISGTSGDQMFLNKFPEPSVPLTFIVTDANCFGSSDGSIELNLPLAYENVGYYNAFWPTIPLAIIANNPDNQLRILDAKYNLAAGYYTVEVSDQFCTTIDSAEVKQPDPIIVSKTQLKKGCFQMPDKEAVVTPSGGTPPYYYSWNNGTQTDSIAINLYPGIQNFTINDNNGCAYYDTLAIFDSPGIFSISMVNQYPVTCVGNCDASAKVVAFGGSMYNGIGYTYQWDDPLAQTTDSAFNLCPGSYYVTVTDGYQCSDTSALIYINDAISIYVDFSVFDASCFGSNDGKIEWTYANGVFPFTYNWSTGSTNDTITSLNAGSYTLTITDGNGCTLENTYTINEPSQIIDNAIISNVSCSGNSDGSIKLFPSGGPATIYNYLWDNNSTNDSISNLAPGNYSVTIYDMDYICSNTFTYTISEPQPLTNSITSSNVSCFGGNNGSATVVPTGGTTPYSYLWSNGFNGGSYSNFTAGFYTVTITDANGCFTNNSINITQPTAALSATISGSSVLCNGASTGNVYLTVTGGTIPYSYSWTNGATTQNLANVTAGTYSVTITDANNCQTTQSITLTEPSAIVLTTSSTNSTCGNSNGSATVNAGGGTGTYSYVWSNGGTTGSITGIASGSYDVTVTDANSCSAFASVVVNDINGPTLSIGSISNVNCFNSSNGSATILASGGTAPLTYLWSNGNTTNSISSVSGGIYTITATDANNCIAILNVTITEPTLSLTSSISATNVTCSGANDGGANLTVSGGTTPYTYNWNNGATTEDLTGISGGTYNVTIADANGCTNNSSIIITEPNSLVVNFSNISNSCAGANNGSLTVTVSGGTQPYTYLWSTTETSQTINNLTAGNYDVTVTDANNCTASLPYSITQSPAINLTINGPSTTLCPGTSVNLSAQPTGGMPPFIFNWTDGYTTPTITVNPTTTTTYSVYVVDNNGCSSSPQSKIINIFSAPALTMTASTDTICLGESVQLIAAVSGGSSPYNYEWSDIGTGTNIRTISPSVSTTYVLTVTDNCSQQVIDNVAITVNPLPTISGIAQYTGGTMTQGKVIAKLFSTISIYDYNGFLLVDSAINGSDNKFYINNVELGEYILKVIPTDNTYPNVLPTYYDSTLLSQYAIKLNVECGIDQDITVTMKEIQPAVAGTFSISGRITVATNNKSVMGEPIPGAEITLEQEPDDEPIANTETNVTGDYSFTGLQAADYSILVDIPGFPQLETHNININNDTSNINYVVDTTSASLGIYIEHQTSISKYELKDFSVNLYPVPFDNKLNIDFTLDSNSDVNIELVDISGKEIESLMSKNLSKGNYSNSYQLENLTYGVYFIKMKVGDTVFLKKILKN